MKYAIFILIIMASFPAFSQKSYEPEWKRVDSLANLGQPKSALEIADKIYSETKQENNATQFVKASLYRMALMSGFEEDFMMKAISATESDLSSVTGPVKNILHSVLAELYWRYYQNNRYQFLDRTETKGFQPGDVRTWDLKKIVQKCIENYSASLENPELLKSIAIRQYDAVLVSRPDSRNFRPTLFDFLAHRAADFYMNSEAGITQPAARFLVDKPGYFLPSADFSSIPILSGDTLSFEFHALKLMQQIIAFHQDDKDPTALVDAEIKRFGFVHNHCILPEKDSLYLTALRKLENHFLDHPSSAEVSFQIAQHLISTGNEFQPLNPDAHKWDLKEAFTLADAAIHRFPDSFGAKNCRVLLEQIRLQTLDITGDYASVPDKPSLMLVTYKNISAIHFRLLKIDPSTDREIAENANGRLIPAYLGRKADLAWTQAMPEDGDYQEHKAEIKLPSLSTGYYVLLASPTGEFSDEGLVSLNRFWRTGISYLSRRNDSGSYELYVLGRQEGQALSRVKVQSFYREYDYRTRSYSDQPGDVFFSDNAGFVALPSGKKDRSNQYYLVFTSANDQFITESYFSGYYYRQDAPKKVINTYFFTDRAIYRPGQTIYFKGIAIERQDKEVYLKTGYKTSVNFYDVNGQKVSSLDLISNEFGSFTGTFIAPQGALTGMMNIQCETGNMSVQVEEYKRPKFEITFNPITGSYKLGEVVEVKGKAVAFAGNSISDAQATYRVVRTARFPYMWWGWREWMPESPEMEITNGTSITNENGEFIIRFTAIPDPTLDRKYNPVFSYRIFANVTDMNGETHDGETTLSVGYNALLASTDLPDAINIDSILQFSLSTTNLNGQKEAAKGKITIWKLKEPLRLLRNRNWSRPDRFILTRQEFEKDFPNDIYEKEDDYTTWEKEKLAWFYDFDTRTDSLLKIKEAVSWKTGRYMYKLETNDAFGEKVENSGSFLAYSPSAKSAPGNMAGWFTALKSRLEPGETASFLVGSSARNVTVIYEVQQNDKTLSRKILSINQGQLLLTIPVLETYRGNFAVNVSFVKMNRSYQYTKTIEVPWTNRKLDIRFASFRSKLQPGQEEEWQVTIQGSKGEKAAAELLAGMYDASLDSFILHSWNFSLFNYFNRQHPWDGTSAFGARGSIMNRYSSPVSTLKNREYDDLNWFGFEMYGGNFRRVGGMKMMADHAVSADELKKAPLMSMVNEESAGFLKADSAKGVPPSISPKATKPSAPQAAKIRSDFNETAFFYPQLSTNENGEVVIRFKIPESLTRWKMMGLAYTKDLKIGQIEKTLVTQKDLMVFPNAPRFFREGDKMQFSTKISNISSYDLNGTAELHFFDALTMKPVDDKILLDHASVLFSAKKGGGTVVNWSIIIPEEIQAIVYRVVASSETFSDGEEAAIPVLTNRMLVTESMPLPINGGQTKSFTFEKLYNSGKGSPTLRNYRLSLEFTSNPAWYAVQALPYLMEYPYECAEQLFSRYYANSIASYIANSNPKIKGVFENWKNISPDALKSNLEKNQELKSVLLEECPWVREATNESERKQRIAVLFDLNRMSNELGTAVRKLRDMQASNGGWPWFQGMPDSRYITQHIVTGLGHLDHLGISDIRENPQTRTMLQMAVKYLDARITEDFEKIKESDKDYIKNDHLGYEDVQYLYARSYFMPDFPLEKNYMEAFNYYKVQATAFWKSRNNYLKGMIALALNRFSDTKTPDLILRSLSETALHNEEMGMYWRSEERGWFWYQAPIETQALLIEAFDEILNDTKTVDELKIWLLKQKQTQDWKTTKATTEAVYALLLKGTDLLASDRLATVKVGNQEVDPTKQEGSAKPEAGTGYFKTSWSAGEISPAMGKVIVTNPNSTVAWGALYWQYFEQLDKITSAQTPLSLSKKLFREINTPTGPVIEPVIESTSLHVGDKVVVRVELRTDRDMEYVHLKDMRASAFEPVNVLSGYRWQDGLGYYEATRDASSNFFINYLPKGTYVFEYRLFATQKGKFSNGITTVQCMYAPEFAAHSEGIRVTVE